MNFFSTLSEKTKSDKHKKSTLDSLFRRIFKTNDENEPPSPFLRVRPKPILDLNSKAITFAKALPQPRFHGITDYESYEFYEALRRIVDKIGSHVKNGYVHFTHPNGEREYCLSQDEYLKFVSKIYGVYFEIYFRDSLPKNFYYLMRGSIEKKTRYNKPQLSTNDFLKIFHWKNNTPFKLYSEEFLTLKEAMLYDNKKVWLRSLKN